MPLFVIVNWAVAVAPTCTLPNARFPVRLMMRVGGAVPVPETAIVLVPPVWSALTTKVPL